MKKEKSEKEFDLKGMGKKQSFFIIYLLSAADFGRLFEREKGFCRGRKVAQYYLRIGR